MSGHVSLLAVNVGSSSLKLARFDLVAGEPVERWRRSDTTEPDVPPDLAGNWRDAHAPGSAPPGLVVHRIVHGGADHAGPALVDDALVAELWALEPFAPLHQPAGLRGVAAAQRAFPDAVQVACFDTAFHRSLPPVATHLGLPHGLWERGIRRYGFHGLSFEHVVDEVGADRLGRAVIAHLGSGASLCAVVDGRSVDTTMGLSPAGGVVMGTRPGDLDPGVLTHLARHGLDGDGPLDTDTLEDLVNHRSGLLGLSGRTSDMQQLLGARATDPAADLAVRVFCRSVAKAVGSLVPVLGGIDTLVFTGGIGEHAAPIRAEVCEPLGFLGLAPDRVLVVAADEELTMARQAAPFAPSPAG